MVKLTVGQQAVVDQAIAILNNMIEDRGLPISSPSTVRDYIRLKMERLEREVFAVLFLDSQHRVIKYEEIFTGTLDGSLVEPREVIKRCLELGSKSILIYHNHPSGCPRPSRADRFITKKIQNAANLFDITVLDHIVVGAGEMVSFADLEWL